jgi:hypothetical protein
MRRYFGRRRGYDGRPGNRQLLIVLVVGVLLYVLLSNNRHGCSTRAAPVGCESPTAPLAPRR